MRLFERPRAISRSTSSSRGVSTSSARGRAAAGELLDHARRDGGGERRLAGVGGADRAHELGRLGVLEQEARRRPPRSAANSRSSSPKLVSTSTRAAGTRSRSARSARDAVEPRHREVEQHDVGREPLGRARPPPRRRPPRRRPRRRPAAPGRSAGPGARPRGRRRSGRGSRRDLQPHGRALARPRRRSSAARRARSRAPPSTSARAAGRAPPARRRRSRAPSSATVSTSRPPPSSSRTSIRSRVGVAQRVLQRLLGDPEHLAGRVGAPSAGGAATRSSIACAGDAPQHVDVLAQRLREPLGLQRRRAQLEHDRAQLVHRAARERLHALDLRRRRAPSPRASSSPADSAASTTPNSCWVTESCSSRASRLRSSTMLSSRLRSCRRAFSIAIAACAASSTISRSSASENAGRADPCR